jgi:hypothetical protein
VANPSKAKGSSFETELVNYLRTAGWPSAERRALSGNVDKGDVTGTPSICWEAKAHATVTDGLIREWIEQTRLERKHANADIGVLVVKRPRKNVADSWAWTQGPWGTWHCQWLKDCVADLLDMGYGTRPDRGPHD